MNTTPLKNFAIQSRNLLKKGVLNRILALGFDADGGITVDEPIKIQGGCVFMGQLKEESFYYAWMELKERINSKGVKEVCEEAAYTWFNRLVAIRILQKNRLIEPVMEYVDEASRVPVIVSQARSGRLTLPLNAADKERLNRLLSDPTRTDEQFSLLIEAFCELNPVIYNCFGGIERHISLLLPDNILSRDGFVDLLNNTAYLTDEDYAQTELIGWLYQFYISEKKDEVFASKEKVAKEDIPAATQIFTPNWIVKYMVQNTLGRIYLDNNPYSTLGDGMKYLVKTETSSSPDTILRVENITDYKIIDPACGSGHILIEGFDLLYSMYMDDLYSPRAAIENIFRKNLIGIDLDTRAQQLATFALLLKAAQKDRSFLDAKVMPRVLDMPRPFAGSENELRTLLSEFFAGGSGDAMKETVEAFELLKQADNLGSIMKFDLSEATRHLISSRTAAWESNDLLPEGIKDILPSMRLILTLTDKYTAVVANPPYMGSGNMNSGLSNYVKQHYEDGKADLFSVFMIVAEQMLVQNGKYGMINMQSWMFLSSFEKLREHILTSLQIDNMLHLGPRTFDELSGEVVQNTAFVITNGNPSDDTCGNYSRLVDGKNCADKEHMFLSASSEGNKIYYPNATQKNFGKIPGSPIGYWVSEKIQETFTSNRPLSAVANPCVGLQTADNGRFLRQWFEVDQSRIGFGFDNAASAANSGKKWFPYNKGGGFRKWYGLNELVVNWYRDGAEIKSFNGSVIRNPNYYFKEGITFPRIGSDLFYARYSQTGFIFDCNGPSCFPSDNLKYILGFMNSSIMMNLLKVLCPTLSFQIGDSFKVPYKAGFSDKIDNFVSQNISISKADWDAHETSWDFQENELIRILKSDATPHLQVNGKPQPDSEEISSLVEDYRRIWEYQFRKLHENEEELNRQFIEIYGLQDELTPDVPLDEVTILQQGEISIENGGIVWHDDVIIRQLLSYAIGCWMGRYRLDKPGLNIAHYPSEDEICSYPYNGGAFTIDDDGIIPLMPQQNPFEDDNALQKIVKFVRLVFGEDFLTQNLNFIEQCLRKSIEDYLVKDFWKDHKKMYQNRPIYWLFSSKKGAFQVLAYMHRMNPYTAEKVRTKYLLPYIEYLQSRIQQDRERGSDLSTVERKNLSRMEAALTECQEYHDRLHEVADKQIGFDLDDGVAVNHAKFGDALAKIK